MFEFDQVFGGSATQSAVFDQFSPMLTSVRSFTACVCCNEVLMTGVTGVRWVQCVRVRIWADWKWEDLHNAGKIRGVARRWCYPKGHCYNV